MLIGHLNILFYVYGVPFQVFCPFFTVTDALPPNVGEKEIFTYLDITLFIGLGLRYIYWDY